MTARVNILMHIFLEKCKKVQNGMLFESCDLHFNLLWNYLNNAPEYIDPSSHFVFYKKICSSNFYKDVFPFLWLHF